jgi:hypothetical protein
MIDIIPAVLPKNFSDLEESLERLRGIAPLVQVDLVGSNVLKGHEEMPFWQDFDFEFDIMLSDPAAEVEVAVLMGASRIDPRDDHRDARGGGLGPHGGAAWAWPTFLPRSIFMCSTTTPNPEWEERDRLILKQRPHRAGALRGDGACGLLSLLKSV